MKKENDIHIGKPIANTQVYITDQYGNLLPVGAVGELCIAGDGVGAGYLNRPGLTAEKFVDNPFGTGKLYKTGDLAYWREDGNIGYVGRNDFQVKIRGLRIELGEIENAVSSIDGVMQAVVVVRKNKEDRQLLCAFYTGEGLGAKEIRARLSKSLPKYMLPHEGDTRSSLQKSAEVYAAAYRHASGKNADDAERKNQPEGAAGG